MAGPRRQWGWHQLDAEWARRLVADAQIGPGDLVLDIGAGHGVVTAELLAVGARVIAVERHSGRVDALRERFGDRVTVVAADAADLRLPRRPYKVVANPPFAVTSALLRRLLQPGTRLISADLVLQAAAAHRWSAPDAPGARRWQRTHRARVAATVPSSAFTPPPGVACRVLQVRPVRGHPALSVRRG